MFNRTIKSKYFCVFLLISAVKLTQARQGGNIANHYFLEKQKFLIEILHHVDQPLLNRDWLGIGKQLIVNQTNYIDFNQEMRDFQATYENGSLLPKYKVFNVHEPVHYQQAYGLFYYFYNTNDWETLLLNACWARTNINPGMFVFALTQALIKRCDVKGLILPEIYEILPQLFLEANEVYTALKFDYGQYIQAEVFYKNYKNHKSQSGEIYLKEKHQHLNQNATMTHKPRALADLTKLVLPAYNAYSRNMDYFTQDFGWNAHWYYQNMGLWWNEVNNNEINILEIWFGILQQILARFKLESYSAKNMAAVKRSATKNSPKLLYIDGSKFRDMGYQNQVFYYELTTQVQQLISEQKLELKNGTTLDLANGRNWPIVLNKIFGTNLPELYKRFFAVSSRKTEAPNLQMFFETQLRAPKFLEKAEILLKNYQLLRANFQSYKLGTLKQSSVAIENVTISKLQTYFENFHFDASNLLPSKHFYYDGHLIWQKTLQARQRRLQHKAFDINLNITATTPQAVIVRSFLAPPQTKALDPSEFFLLDAFIVDLVAGSNFIQRKSTEFFNSPKRLKLDLSTLYRLILLGLDDQYEFPLNIKTAKCGFPQHLLLPRGDAHGAGLPVQFFFIVTPYQYRFHGAPNFDCDFSDGVIRFDELPFGFSFDYDHEELESWSDANVYWKRDNIYHIN